MKIMDSFRNMVKSSLARLLKLAGRDVITQYYVNDMGRQIAIIVCGITECGLKIEDYEGEKIDHKIGKLYFDANKAVEEDEALNAKVDELIQKYEQGEDEELNKVFEDVVSKCISGMKESLSRMNIVHDDFVWEGQFIRNGEVDDLVAYIQKEGFTRESDVLYIDLTDFNIEKELKRVCFKKIKWYFTLFHKGFGLSQIQSYFR